MILLTCRECHSDTFHAEAKVILNILTILTIFIQKTSLSDRAGLLPGRASRSTVCVWSRSHSYSRVVQPRRSR
jgi:hypothetical protein